MQPRFESDLVGLDEAGFAAHVLHSQYACLLTATAFDSGSAAIFLPVGVTLALFGTCVAASGCEFKRTQ
jgi:hypothetical protein